MATQWFQVDATTRNIEGWGRTSGDEMPTTPEGKTLVAASDADLAEYESLRAAMTADGRADAPRYINGVINTPQDARLRLCIEVDRTVAMVGEAVEFAVTAIDHVGETRQDFNERVPCSMLGGRVIAFDFVDGVAVRPVAMTHSGRYVLRSDSEIALESPVEILVLE